MYLFRVLCSACLGGQSLEYVEFLGTEKISILPVCSHVYGLTIFILYFELYSYIYFSYFFAQVVPASAIGSSFRWLFGPFT